MATITINYDSAGDYVRDMTDMGRSSQSGCGRASQDTGRRDFFWTSTFAEAKELWLRGWQEGADKVARHREGFNAFIAAAKTAKSQQFAWDVEGDFGDASRIAMGEPECCGSYREAGDSAANRVVSIRLNNCVSASIDANIICARGLAVLVAVDLLEACGIRCEVVVGTATKAGSSIVESNVTVKRAGEMVEPSAIAFNVAHPSFFRRFGFRFMELNGHSPSGCYPCPMSDYGRQGTIEIDEILSGVRLSQDAIMRNVIAIAAKCGLTFDEGQMAELVAAASST